MGRLEHPNRRRRRRSAGQGGQSLVEFSLVILPFIVIVVAIVEFAFLLTVKTGVGFASQDAVQLAAELGNTPDADSYILQQIEKDIQTPVDKTQIISVSIFWTDLNGASKAADTWKRTGSTKFDTSKLTLPYSQDGLFYPESDRCSVILGCGGLHTGVDWIGVTITYQYGWATPLPSLVGLGGGAPVFVETNTSRLEPIQ